MQIRCLFRKELKERSHKTKYLAKSSTKNTESEENILQPPKRKRSETRAEYQLGSLHTEGRLRFRPESTQREGTGGERPRLGATSGRGVTECGTPHHRRGSVPAPSLLPHVSGDLLGGRHSPRSEAEHGQAASPRGGSKGRNRLPLPPPGAIHKNPTATFARVRAETVSQANSGPQDKGRRCVPKSTLTTIGRTRALMGRRITQEPEPRRHSPGRAAAPPGPHSPPRYSSRRQRLRVNGRRRGTGSAVRRRRTEHRPTDFLRPAAPSRSSRPPPWSEISSSGGRNSVCLSEAPGRAPRTASLYPRL